MNIEHGIKQTVLPHLVKTNWQTQYEKQTQKIHLQTAFFILASQNATMIGYSSKAKFSKLMMKLFREYTPSYKGIFFQD